jgi:hypothetical protein
MKENLLYSRVMSCTGSRDAQTSETNHQYFQLYLTYDSPQA